MRLWNLAGLFVFASLAACAAEGDDGAESTEQAAVLAKPYPIVLAHGFFGFDDFAGAGFISYFSGVVDHLNAHGEPLVFTPTVDPFNDSEYRGKQLLARVQEILKKTGARKVNIIGHSQGGLDARYVAHERPDLVASVTTIATPHRGTPISNFTGGLFHIPFSGAIFDGLTQLLGGPLWDEIGNETSIGASAGQFTTQATTEFNAKYPDVAGIPYFSVAGRSAGSLGGDACKTSAAPPWIRRWDGTRDAVTAVFAPMQPIVAGWSNAPNDGLLRVESARWGTFLGCVPADHLDQIGQLFNDQPGPGNHWSHLEFYSDLVKYLRDRGL